MKTHVFNSGQDGYNTYRIPALLTAQNGDLLAFCEGRRNTPRDYGDIDLLVKRSSDGGQSWSPQQVVHAETGDVTIGNPCPVLDRHTGVIWMLFCRDNIDVFVTQSDDDGHTWSRPIDIGAMVKHEDWSWYATGPGVGIQLERGPHKGRLVVPCDHRRNTTYGNGSHVVYSDDHGQTWRMSGIIKPGANECQVGELADGTLMMNIRLQTHSRGFRGVSTSQDGGQTWTDLIHEEQLLCPKCQAAFVADGRSLLFSNPVPSTLPDSEKGERFNLVVRRSVDGGKTWNDLTVLHPGPAAYSSLLFLSPDEAACLYEAGEEDFREHLVFQRFPV